MPPAACPSDGGFSSDSAAREELDRALARVAFRALGSRDSEKLRELAGTLSPTMVRHSVRTAADIFVHTVLCAVNGTPLDPELEAAAAAAAATPSAHSAESTASPDASADIATGGRRSLRRLSVSRRKSETVRKEPVARIVGDDLTSCCQEMSRLSTAFAELTASHRTAVSAVCNEVLRTVCPLLVGIQAQYSKGIGQAVDETRKNAARVNKLLAVRGRSRSRRSVPMASGDGDVLVLTERVAIAASEALFQSGRAVDMLKSRLSCGGFKAVVASSRLDTRHLLPKKRADTKGARAASLLNIVDGRAAELASITSKFSDDVDRALSYAQGFGHSRRTAM